MMKVRWGREKGHNAFQGKALDLGEG